MSWYCSLQRNSPLSANSDKRVKSKGKCRSATRIHCSKSASAVHYHSALMLIIHKHESYTSDRNMILMMLKNLPMQEDQGNAPQPGWTINGEPTAKLRGNPRAEAIWTKSKTTLTCPAEAKLTRKSTGQYHRSISRDYVTSLDCSRCH